MKEVKIDVGRKLTKEELRLINFVSEEIHSFSCEGNILTIILSDIADEYSLISNVKLVLESFEKHKVFPENIYQKITENRRYYSDNEIINSGLFEEMRSGMFVLKNDAVKLFEFFDYFFVELLNGFDVEYRKMPVLLPMETYIDSRYLATSPQYSIFCSFLTESFESYQDLPKKIKGKYLTKFLKYPKYSLTPSACFHLYEELRNGQIDGNKLFTFRQSVFRNEGRFNWNEKTRFLDYTVREIVFIGDDDYVISMRKNIMDRVIKFIEDIGLDSMMIVGADPFVIPEMQLYKKIQMRNKVKYELRLYNSATESTACASFNLHGSSFSSSFNFKVVGNDSTVSGCIGFGIERWVYSFLNQFGTRVENWPLIVREYLDAKRGTLC